MCVYVFDTQQHKVLSVRKAFWIMNIQCIIIYCAVFISYQPISLSLSYCRFLFLYNRLHQQFSGSFWFLGNVIPIFINNNLIPDKKKRQEQKNIMFISSRSVSRWVVWSQIVPLSLCGLCVFEMRSVEYGVRRMAFNIILYRYIINAKLTK